MAQQTSLERIYAPVHEDLERVKLALKEHVSNMAESWQSGALDTFIRKAISHLFETPGKWLRPALVLMAGRATNTASRADSLVELATAMELIHTASLIHDDVIDEADHRRALSAVHKQFGVKTAILVGDILYSQAFAVVANLPDADESTRLGLLDNLTGLTRRMCYAEIFEQQALEQSKKISRDDYLHVLEYKTALLMSVSCQGGSFVAGGDEDTVEALRRFGLDFGFAYQLMDDHRDRDQLYDGRIDLREEACSYVSAAHESISVIPESTSVQSLHELADFILRT